MFTLYVQSYLNVFFFKYKHVLCQKTALKFIPYHWDIIASHLNPIGNHLNSSPHNIQ